MIFLWIIQTNWFSWLLQLNGFYLFTAFSGIKWRWAFLLLLMIELFELHYNIGYSTKDWFTQPDTVMDIAFGCIGIWQGTLARQKKLEKNNKETKQ